MTPSKPKQADDFIRIQDLFYLCLAKWRWFVVSLAVTLGIAVYYLLTTPPVYTRSASLLIKEDSKGQSLSSDVSSTFADMGLFQANTNVNNELLSLQSPAVMLDVVKRLHLNIDYLTDGAFYKQVLYGQTLPMSISFFGLQDNETASLTLRQGASGKLELSGFTRNGEEVEGQIEGKLNDTIASPIGKLMVEPTPYYNIGFHEPVYITRSTLHGATDAYSSRLSVAASSVPKTC